MVQVVPSSNIVADNVATNEHLPVGYKEELKIDMSLKEYVEQHMDEEGEAVENPAYLFRKDQFIHDQDHPFDVDHHPWFDNSSRFSWGPTRRAEKSLFFLGPAHSGAYFHTHTAAWNAVVYGKKRWFL